MGREERDQTDGNGRALTKELVVPFCQLSPRPGPLLTRPLEHSTSGGYRMNDSVH